MTNERIDAFLSLNKIFMERGFSLYLVGGTVRDYLLNIELVDMDAVTDALPSDMELFLESADFSFKRFGSVKIKYLGFKFDITTMRKEAGYDDFRHPNQIEFCDSLKIDVLRRDFTINGLYMDKDLEIIDYINGVKDLENKIIKTIGGADKRIKEDPLRIFRAIRFMVEFDFSLDEELLNAIIINKNLVRELNIEKIIMEIKRSNKQKEMLDVIKKLDIPWYNTNYDY